MKRRVSADLKRLDVLLRRLTFLMALRVGLAPLVLRPASNYFEKSEGEPEARKAFFSVLPTLAREAPDFLHGPIIVPTRGPVPAALALVSRGLTVQLTLALRDWPSFDTSRTCRTISNLAGAP